MNSKLQLVNVGWVEKHWGITHDTPRLTRFLDEHGITPVKVTGEQKKKRWYISGDFTSALKQEFKKKYPTREEKQKQQPQLPLKPQQQAAAQRKRGPDGTFVPGAISHAGGSNRGEFIAVNKRLDAIVETIQLLSTKFETFAAAVGSPVQPSLFDDTAPAVDTTKHN